MVFFTNDGRVVEYNKKDNDRISGGRQGEVYKFNSDKCIKLYYEDEEKQYRISDSIFSLFKSLDLDSYCKLYDLLFDKDNNIMGYTMKYYEETDNNILLMPIEYTLDNLSSIYNSIMILTDNNVMAKDLYCKNSVVTDNKIVVIDFDSCLFSNYSNEVLREVNITNLHYLFKSLYIDGFKKLGIDAYNKENSYIEDNISELFKYSDNMPKTLSRKLSPYKKPIDLLKRKGLSKK